MEIRFVVNAMSEGKRLDLFMAAQCPGFSRSSMAALLKNGNILVDGQRKKPSCKVHYGNIVSGSIEDKDGDTPPIAEPIDLDIIYDDFSILVLNKQPGIVVHPAPGNTTGTLVNALLNYCPAIESVGDDHLRPGIVHRLDRDTSGMMVVAKKESAFQFLKKEFMYRRVRKSYLAFVSGNLKEKRGQIIMPIGRHPVKRKIMSTVSHNGRYAETLWHVRKSYAGVDLVEAELKTGRTHQIRVHFKALGHPLIGDRVYGFKKKVGKKGHRNDFMGKMERKVNRHMLHAWQLSFRHPWSGRRICFTAPVPEDMRQFMEEDLLQEGTSLK